MTEEEFWAKWDFGDYTELDRVLEGQRQQIRSLISEINNPIDYHVIEFTDDGWTIQHPLLERLDGSLFECVFHWMAEDPGVRGKFVMTSNHTHGRQV